MKTPSRTEQIDAVLPQTQCGLCQFSSCRPYAEALAEDTVAINRCPPGGIETLLALASLLEKDPTPFLSDMQQNAKPATIAVIREEACIGCTKCIQACPTDAILGSHKQMHTIITDACTGCGLCVAPCPVDCIDMIPAKSKNSSEKKSAANQWRARYVAREQRLLQEQQQRYKQHSKKKPLPIAESSLAARKIAIQEAVQRVQNRKNERSHE